MPAADLPPSPPLPRRRRRRWPVGAMVLVAVLALFTAGVVHLFDLRFSAGEIYPVYSSLRSDPLGTKALYYSLQALPGLRVERNVRPLRYLGEEPSAVLQHRDDDPDPAGGSGATAVLYLGADPYAWPFLVHEAEAARLEKIMERGGRVIMAFFPTSVEMTGKRLENNRHEQSKDKEDKNGKTGPTGTPLVPPAPTPARDQPASSPALKEPLAIPAPPLTPSEKLVMEDLVARWHLDFLRSGDKKDAKKTGPQPISPPLDKAAVPVPGSAAGLDPVTWHGTVDFNLDAAPAKEAHWRALYVRSRRPVIVTRPFGTAGGELVLISDPYFFSNEALRKEPRPGLLAALVGPCRRIIFDETHLGVLEKPGMMTLARRYHLEGALAALAVLAVLFLWKNMVSLVPPRPPVEAAGVDAGAAGGLSWDESAAGGLPVAAGGNFVAGRDSAEGFVNLLRRGVSTCNLLAACLTQWRAANTLPGSRPPGLEVVMQLNSIAEEEAAKPSRRRSLVTAYRAMCAVLKRRGAAPES